MAFVVPAIFTAVDKMSVTVTRMAGTVRGFAATSDASFAKLERGFRSTGKQADSMFNTLTGGHAGIAVAAGICLATVAVSSFIN